LHRPELQGVHSIVKYDEDGRTVWPQEEQEHRPAPRKPWSADKAEPPLPPAQFAFKRYEFALLAAFARCHRGRATLKELPAIPVDMADLILRHGGLSQWIDGDEKRRNRFWEMVRAQSLPRKPAPQIKVAKGRRR